MHVFNIHFLQNFEEINSNDYFYNDDFHLQI